MKRYNLQESMDYFVLDLCLNICDCVIGLDIEGDHLSGEGFDENLHCTTAESKDKTKGRFFLDVVVRKCSASKELDDIQLKTYHLRVDFHRRSVAVALEGFLPKNRKIKPTTKCSF